ncbi:hypothetical protein VAR608DRAFT_1094 [Variovorax sp. HW608]|uniref:hypothetical protein n=1 Tax=Variovorax sp. HW608 TaxID=1034889 RepID=UPI00081F7EA5|nr:hypothetical protein [Variovorax sp. HW608]SCK16453.1 hypothetical protein VAR608DRAFT_1094 [Variovorax sp. HW608]
MSAKAPHLDEQTLLAYWFGDTDEMQTDAIDLHLLGCDRCGRTLDELVALGDAVRRAFDLGLVHAFVSGPFVQRLVDEGRHMREYRLAHNGSVNCSAAPQDEVLVARFEAPLADVERIDAVLHLSFADDAEYRADDIPFDPASGEVLMVPKIAIVRGLPAHVLTVRLIAHAKGELRTLGEYRLNHSPWAGA